MVLDGLGTGLSFSHVWAQNAPLRPAHVGQAKSGFVEAQA